MCSNSEIMSDYVVITTTIDDVDKADKLARKIVDARLAACVQQSPVKSTYRWKAEVHVSDEILLTAKTRRALADKLLEFIKENHDYEVPELLVTPVLSGDADYLEWMAAETAE
jgi:periplasmic divalent cation tolerance protein